MNIFGFFCCQKILSFYTIFWLVLSSTSAFEDQEGFYQSYQQKAPIKKRGGGFGDLLLSALTGAAGFFAGQWYDKHQQAKLKKKHATDIEKVWKSSVLEREQMIKNKDQEILQLSQKLKEGYKQIEEQESLAYQYGVDVGMGTLQADYEEFKMPDADGDDRITREEFNAYVRAYMKAYPDIPLEEYPKFEDFDMNKDGVVTFEEWQQFLFRQRLEEQQAAQAMYEQSGNADNFQALYDQLLNQANVRQ
mmetsp:Transcript_23616/g.30863  ORF Transcript_23616/g.30863 Transcript_23616/m.30863 type:complete len:248 (+) Transcript_23616:94-837(+)